MLYLGYVDNKVVERLPSLLELAKINPNKEIKYDFGSFDGMRLDNFLDYEALPKDLFIIFPINQFFRKKAFVKALELIRLNRTVIFCNVDYTPEDTNTHQSNEEPKEVTLAYLLEKARKKETTPHVHEFLVIHNGNVHTKQYKPESNTYFKLESSTYPRVDPWYESIVELTNNRKLALKFIKDLKDNHKFRSDIEMLFETLDATIIGKNQLIQKLMYVLQFTKYADTYMLKETYGDDALYKAQTVIGMWKNTFNLEMDAESIAIVYEPEYLDLEIIDRLNFEDNLTYEGEVINE